MKYLSILAVASLALSPAFAAAQSTNSNKPTPGPLAGRALGGTAVPGAGVAVLGLLLVGGMIVAMSGSSDANNNTNGQNVEQ